MRTPAGSLTAVVLAVLFAKAMLSALRRFIFLWQITSGAWRGFQRDPETPRFPLVL